MVVKSQLLPTKQANDAQEGEAFIKLNVNMSK